MQPHFVGNWIAGKFKTKGYRLLSVLGVWAAAGLSGFVRGGRKAGPAGLRWLLKSPPRRAGQAPAPLRAKLFNPCRIKNRHRSPNRHKA
jgi:hypothetical protein